MSALTKTSLESALNLIRRRFLKKAYEARSDESVTVAFEIRRCLAVSADSNRFKRANELLESALGRWREGFARVGKESFGELCSLAFAHPEWVEADPVAWARAQIDTLMSEELSSKRSHDVQWNARGSGADQSTSDTRPTPGVVHVRLRGGVIMFLSGTLPFSYAGVWRAFRRAAVKAGIGHLSSHAFRHTHRSWLDSVGTPVGVQQRLMRHNGHQNHDERVWHSSHDGHATGARENRATCAGTG